MILLNRAAQLADMLRAYKIIVDGQQVGTIRRGRQVRVDVAPGRHSIWLRIDWTESNKLDFVSDGSPLELECGSNFAGWRALLGVKHAVTSGPGYLWLRSKNAN